MGGLKPLLFQVWLLITICLFFSSNFLLWWNTHNIRFAIFSILKFTVPEVLNAFVMCSRHRCLSPRALFILFNWLSRNMCWAEQTKRTSNVVRTFLHIKKFDTVAFSLSQTAILRRMKTLSRWCWHLLAHPWGAEHQCPGWKQMNELWLSHTRNRMLSFPSCTECRQGREWTQQCGSQPWAYCTQPLWPHYPSCCSAVPRPLIMTIDWELVSGRQPQSWATLHSRQLLWPQSSPPVTSALLRLSQVGREDAVILSSNMYTQKPVKSQKSALPLSFASKSDCSAVAGGHVGYLQKAVVTPGCVFLTAGGHVGLLVFSKPAS